MKKTVMNMNFNKKIVLPFIFFLLAFSVISTSAAAPQLIDLTHSFDKQTLNWPTATPFKLKYIYAGHHHNGYFYASNDFSMSEHVGTHMDAPYHFSKHGVGIAGVPLDKLRGKGIVIDVSAKTKNNPDYQISVQDLKQWEKRYGRMPNGAFVLLKTGFYRYWPNRKRYTGTRLIGQRAIKNLHFPGISGKAANWLVNHRKIDAVGIDTLSIDYGQSTKFLAHRAFSKGNVPFFENIANLGKLPPKGFIVYGLPMKIRGGTGAPARVIAVL